MTDSRGLIRQTLSMCSAPKHHITYSDRLEIGIVVVFSDGKQALFSADLLYAKLAEAEPLPEPVDGPDDELGF